MIQNVTKYGGFTCGAQCINLSRARFALSVVVPQSIVDFLYQSTIVVAIVMCCDFQHYN